MSYPTIFRERAIEYRQAGHTLEETRKAFKVSISTIQKWEKQWKEKGNLEKKPLNRPHKKIDPEKLRAYVAEHPDAYQKEMAEEFHCSATAIQKALKRLGITRKKNTTRYREQNPETVKAYQEQIADIPSEMIAYVDETGIDTYLYREYGYAPKGQRVYGRICGHKYKRVGIVAAQIGKQIVAPMQYESTMDSTLFEAWFVRRFLPAIEKGTVIVMDNAAFHRKKQLVSFAHNFNCHLVFLPPYSPDLNPIENFWSWLKRYLRKILPSFNSFDDALTAAFQVV